MSTNLSPFSCWALDAARTADERYMIWMICEACRLQEHWILAPKNPKRQFKITSYQFHKELYLNEALMPPFTEAETECAARMIPHLRKFPLTPNWGETRPIRDAGALRFFPGLESLELKGTELSDISFLHELPELLELSLHTGYLTDLSPLAHCRKLRVLKLHLCGLPFPALVPPLYWCDVSPLRELQHLEQLEMSPNAAVLSGLSFPRLRRALLPTAATVQPDCSFLPDMPALRQLTLDGVQSLRGITRFPALLSLEVSGPLRDWGDAPSLPQLMCLHVNSPYGWPRDVTPLAQAQKLRWVKFSGDIPRNYWPLTAAPRLCELEVAKSILCQVDVADLDVQAVNAALVPWDSVFACLPSREMPPLRFISGEFQSRPCLPERHEDFDDCPVVFLRELLWMHRRVLLAVRTLMRDEYAISSTFPPGEHHMNRHIGFSITSQAAADRLPEVLDVIRHAMTTSPHEWMFEVTVSLSVPRAQWEPERQKWWDILEARRNRCDDDEEEHNKWQIKQKHLIESDFKKRTAEEEGETPDAKELAPPPEILPPEWPPVAVPVSADADDEKAKDFALKPYDEQEQNDDSDDTSDGTTAVETNNDPPEWFLEDPDAHPLADSYRIYATLTIDTFFCQKNSIPTAELLMRRPVDEILPPPPAP